MSHQQVNSSEENQELWDMVVQWIRICLPTQGTQVRSLVWDDPTCFGATKPEDHNYWACPHELVRHND